MTRTWTPGTADPDLSLLAMTPRLVVALDFDGTASPLVNDPMSARALPEVALQIARLSRLPDTTVAYVSGRSLVHLREIAEHDDTSQVVLAGSHGAQYWYPGVGEQDVADDPGERELMERLWERGEQLLAEFPGVELERKTFGLGVHGRPADPAVEARAFEAMDALVAAEAPHWRRRTGNRILEFSTRAEGKDAAIAVLREKFDATGLVFAGDDVTDEDAMRALQPGDLGVRVGPGKTAATLRVQNPQQIAALLETLANERGLRRE